MRVEGRSIEQILGKPDDLKFRLSMTLFARVSSANDDSVLAIEKHFAGRYDQATLDKLESYLDSFLSRLFL
jgi:uncharacterized protein (DUF1810 family)